MQPRKTLLLEDPRLSCRIVIEDCSLRHVAKFQAHALSIFEVNRGKQDHGRHLRKLASSVKPEVLALFRMELGSGKIVTSDDGCNGRAVIRGRHHMLAHAQSR